MEARHFSVRIALAVVAAAALCGCNDGTGGGGGSPSATGSSSTGLQKTCNVLAEYQVWHGLPSHSAAYSGAPWEPHPRPYDSRDSTVIAQHISAAKAKGICGFVVDWYGPGGGYANDEDRSFQDEATQKLFQQAEQSDFQVALLYDEGAVHDSGEDQGSYQAVVQSDLAYAEQYFSSSAYLSMNGAPALFVFPYYGVDPSDDVDPYLNWSTIRADLSSPVTLLDKDPNPGDATHDAAFDGFFAWVKTNPADPSDWGQVYLDWFYDTMKLPEYSGKIAVGGVWPGFDDSLASWGLNRFMSRMGHDTYDATWNRAQQAAVPFIMIATWNDFEEGTDIELGIDMVLDMELTYPEIILRSTPFRIDWTQGGGWGVLQFYKNGGLLKDLDTSSSGQYFSVQPQTAYEIKVWTNGTVLERTVKVRQEDPISGVSVTVLDP